MYFESECEMAVQGHSTSSISGLIECAYAPSYWLSIVTWSYLAPFKRYCRFSVQSSDLTPYSTWILGVFPFYCIADCGSEGQDPKLIIWVINFENVQPACLRYINDRRRDRRTDDLRQQYRALHCVHRAVVIIINYFVSSAGHWTCRIVLQSWSTIFCLPLYSCSVFHFLTVIQLLLTVSLLLTTPSCPNFRTQLDPLKLSGKIHLRIQQNLNFQAFSCLQVVLSHLSVYIST